MYNSFPRIFFSHWLLCVCRKSRWDSGCPHRRQCHLWSKVCFLVFKHGLTREKYTQEETSLPIATKHSSLVVPPVTPSPKKGNGRGDRFIDEALFMDERKPSSMTVPVAMSIPKMCSNYGEHMLIPVTAKMIHSTVSTCDRFILRDGHLLHMVKLLCVCVSGLRLQMGYTVMHEIPISSPPILMTSLPYPRTQ